MDVRIPSSWTQQTQWKPDEAERSDIRNANRWNFFALVIRWLIWWLCSQIDPVFLPTYSQQPPGKLPFLYECLKMSFWLPDAQMTSHERHGGVFFKLVRVQSYFKSQNILLHCFTIFFISVKLSTRIRKQVNKASILKVMSCKNGKKNRSKLLHCFLVNYLLWRVGRFCIVRVPGTFLSLLVPPGYELCPLQQLHLASVLSWPQCKFPSLICVGQGGRM